MADSKINEGASADGPGTGAPRGWFPTQVGDFRILREVGHGGMGVVYEAEQISLGRHVALKVLPGAVQANDPLRKRFEREARIAGKLHHSNIVPIFSVGEHQGVLYYAMQFITGVGLDQLLHELRRQLEKPVGESPGAATPPLAGESGWQVAALALALAEGRLASGVPACGPPAGRVETSPVKPSAPTICVPGQPRAKPAGAGKPRTEVTGPAPLKQPPAEAGRQPPKNPPVEFRRSLPTEVAAAQTMIGAGATDEPTYPEPPPTLADSDPNDVAAWRIPSLAGGMPAVYFPGVARIGVQLASALHYAHSHNVLHRDIKPANLMVDSDGNIWITDFGLAKATDQGDLTVAGDVLGTYRYMAPEALAGRSDAKSDVYSLGLTLFEMLVLKPAFPARERRGNYSESTSVTVPRIERINPAIPRDLATIVQKAVDAEPSRRYQTAGELGEDLQRFLNDEPILARRIAPVELLWRWAKRHRTVALAVATVAVLLLTFSVVTSVMNYRLATRTAQLIAERKRADLAERKGYSEQVERLMVASPATVPELISSLKRAKVDVQEILVERLASISDPAQKLRLLAALTALGTSHAQELCQLTPSLPHSEAQIVLPVLRIDQATVVPQLLRQFETEPDDERRAHIASALLELGEFGPAGRMLALGTDLSLRNMMIRTLFDWHADLEFVPGLLENTTNDDLRSGVCLALALIPKTTISPVMNRRIDAALARVYAIAPDSGSHSAAFRALAFRGTEVPKLLQPFQALAFRGTKVSKLPQPSRATSGKKWFVNSLGMTLVEVPAGYYFPGDYEPVTGRTPQLKRMVIIPRKLFVQDQVVTAKLYTEFQLKYELENRGKGWLPDPLDRGLLPLAGVRWRSAVEFCNWLSERDGREPCYKSSQPGGRDVTLDLSKNGYRLATSAEQEHFYRCGTRTRFFTGGNAETLAGYGNMFSDRIVVGRSYLPNPWGLFDTAGSSPQMSWDAPPLPLDGVWIDPVGDVGQVTAIRAGLMNLGNLFLPATSGFTIPCDMPATFRVVCCDEPPVEAATAYSIASGRLLQAIENPDRPEDLFASHFGRMLCASAIGNLSAAAESAGAILDSLPDERLWSSQRSDWIRYWGWQASPFLDELKRQRPQDTLLRTGLARSLAQRGEWDRAADAFLDVIEDCPVSEEWFECVVVLNVAGRTGDRDRILRVLESRASKFDARQYGFFLARTFSSVPNDVVKPDQVVEWARAGVEDSAYPWTIHTLGMAQFRSGDLVAARATLEGSLAMGWSSWGNSINQYGLALISQLEGDYETALDLIARADSAWTQVSRDEVMSGNIAPTEWMEYQILKSETGRMTKSP